MKKLIVLCIINLCVLCFGIPNSQASQLNFSVTPILPENQKDKDKSYFDLQVEKAKEQELTVKLKNGTDKNVTVDTSINRATTNLNGVVEYGKTKDKKDASLVYNIEDFIEITEPEIDIPAHEEKQLILKVKGIPEVFDGILVGGLTFKEKQEEEDTKEDTSQGLAIANEYAYVVGIVLHGENEDIPSDIKLTNAEAAQVNARNVINASLQNPKPKYLSNLSIDAVVTKKGSKDVLYSSKKKDMQMAPNSNFSYPIPLEGEALKSGEYNVSMNIKSVNDQWELSKDFTIDKETADSLNEKDVTIKKNDTWIYVVIGFSLLMIALAIILVILYKYRKQERIKKEKQRRRRAAIQRRKRQNKTNYSK
ncbi:C-terminal membrane anchored cell surface protein [Carnobacterium maltaromaticum]|uniref:DUF916 and DUF3324 domain-containing protein n=1 Tax=Carnobacterium maltaromaticum TaxID=2751 RepID=UPI00191B9647|nr:DUF916 and DUF3324 domain-containing protein [Carnobacterium maltaromaticum]CAD5896366.1 C-terminal membrane anchored cell surface protein [Carnobacterium maltaromaticum]